jgi:hypothetical protein
MQSKKEERISSIVNNVDSPVKIVLQHDDYTVFETVLTKEDFIRLMTLLADDYIVVYHHGSWKEKLQYPPSYLYTLVLIEQDKPDTEFPDWLRRWEPPEK